MDKGNISELLNKTYFWDVDITPGKTIPARLIIERSLLWETLLKLSCC